MELKDLKIRDRVFDKDTQSWGLVTEIRPTKIILKWAPFGRAMATPWFLAEEALQNGEWEVKPHFEINLIDPRKKD